MKRLLTLLAILLATTGCPTTDDVAPSVDICTKTGERCRMGGGKLGVCMANPDGTFDCASQH